MNNVLTKNQAVNDRLARFVRHGVVACMLACTAAGAMAAGQDRGPRRDEMQQQSMRERFDSRAQEPRYDQRAYEMQMREEAMRRDEQTRIERQQREENRRGGRMTPDERRDLRRQINEAGVDLYPNARRR
ncbi:hypothetical protein LK542_23470 [Massilia sp. IC2-477]|uniref:hypothetical protein n=1 Tax=unclassified Massilia TaxID=2609279 RepID=UPI001D10CC81|nr:MULTISPECIES: hypothetical protein [unclassified Massilia]MCC2958574.1 hypothetical protein [Massilia sp. IC2-477]MCC2974804.1 hypothetical protein [Massilia sp. IC2-476]